LPVQTKDLMLAQIILGKHTMSIRQLCIALLCLIFSGGSLWAQSITHNAIATTTVNNATDWTASPSRVEGAADTLCTGTSTPTGSWVQMSFPAFAIPGAETIIGVEVRVKYRSSSTNTVQLTVSGGLVGNTNSLPSVFSGPSNCSSTAFASTGGNADLWANTAASLTAAASAGNLGFRLTQNGPTVDIDAVELIVHHTEADDTPCICIPLLWFWIILFIILLLLFLSWYFWRAQNRSKIKGSD